MTSNLNEIKDLLHEQQKHQNEQLTNLMGLVEKSAIATTEANVINRDVKIQLAGIKTKNWFDLLSQFAQFAFWGAIIAAFIYSGLTNKPVKIGNILDIGSTAIPVENVTK